MLATAKRYMFTRHPPPSVFLLLPRLLLLLLLSFRWKNHENSRPGFQEASPSPAGQDGVEQGRAQPPCCIASARCVCCARHKEAHSHWEASHPLLSDFKRENNHGFYVNMDIRHEKNRTENSKFIFHRQPSFHWNSCRWKYQLQINIS